MTEKLRRMARGRACLHFLPTGGKFSCTQGGKCMVENVITKLENLNLADRFLFDEVMEDTQSYQDLVSILLENEISLLTRPQTEKELRLSPPAPPGQARCHQHGSGQKALLHRNAEKGYREFKAPQPVLPGAARRIPVRAGDSRFQPAQRQLLYPYRSL